MSKAKRIKQLEHDLEQATEMAQAVSNGINPLELLADQTIQNLVETIRLKDLELESLRAVVDLWVSNTNHVCPTCGRGYE
jgi:hypothetical protein